MPKAFSKYQFLLLFLSFLFIGVNGYFLFHGNYYFSLLPLAVSVVYFSFYKTKELLFFVILCTPFSLNLEQLALGNVGFYLPTEPILFGLMILLSIKAFLRGTYDKKLLNHPITLSVFFYLFWMGITAFTSSNPIVSVKFLIAKLWFVIPLFFYLIIVFRKKENADEE